MDLGKMAMPENIGDSYSIEVSKKQQWTPFRIWYNFWQIRSYQKGPTDEQSP